MKILYKKHSIEDIDKVKEEKLTDKKYLIKIINT